MSGDRNHALSKRVSFFLFFSVSDQHYEATTPFLPNVCAVFKCSLFMSFCEAVNMFLSCPKKPVIRLSAFPTHELSENQNQNQNSLLVKRQNDNTSPEKRSSFDPVAPVCCNGLSFDLSAFKFCFSLENHLYQ